MAPYFAASGSSSRKETAALMWLPAGPRNSPKTGVIVTTGHQPADTPRRLSGLFAGGLVGRGGGQGRGVSETLAEQHRERSHVVSNLPDIGVRRYRQAAGPAPATGRKRRCGGDSFPPVNRGICRRHERGEQPGYPVLVVAGEEPDDLEGVEARREHVLQGDGLPEADLDTASLMHGSSPSSCAPSTVSAQARRAAAGPRPRHAALAGASPMHSAIQRRWSLGNR